MCGSIPHYVLSIRADCPELCGSSMPNNTRRCLFSSMFSGLGPAVVSEDSVHYVPGVILAISAGCNTENRLFLQSCAGSGEVRVVCAQTAATQYWCTKQTHGEVSTSCNLAGLLNLKDLDICPEICEVQMVNYWWWKMIITWLSY